MHDALIGHRRQVAFTVVYHCLFPTLTIGLALLIVVMKAMALTFHSNVKVTCSPSPHRAYTAANDPEGFRTALHCGSSAFASPMPIASSISVYIAVRHLLHGKATDSSQLIALKVPLGRLLVRIRNYTPEVPRYGFLRDHSYDR
jgi:hypothetical protein